MAAKVGHEAAIAKVGQFTDRAQAIGRHLDQVLKSRSFKGSRRSQEFLRYIIEKSLCGDFDELKERVLGVEIFGRAPTYNTSEDAIVRVAANEVRKRLLRYYEGEGAHSEFRIHLPSGSYIPEFSEVSLISTSTSTRRTTAKFAGTEIPSLASFLYIFQLRWEERPVKRGPSPRLSGIPARIAT